MDDRAENHAALKASQHSPTRDLMTSLSQLAAHELAQLLESREVAPSDVVAACLTAISDREDAIRAWQYVDTAGATESAARLESPSPHLPLRGIPVGVKDVFDTFDMPTTYGSPIYEGYRPVADS